MSYVLACTSLDVKKMLPETKTNFGISEECVLCAKHTRKFTEIYDGM